MATFKSEGIFDSRTIACAIGAIEELSEGAAICAFGDNINGVMKEREEYTKEQNMYDWLATNYQMVSGALNLISYTCSLIGTICEGRI